MVALRIEYKLKNRNGARVLNLTQTNIYKIPISEFAAGKYQGMYLESTSPISWDNMLMLTCVFPFQPYRRWIYCRKYKNTFASAIISGHICFDDDINIPI